MATLNIGGGDDEFYRYKMPDIQVKIEGRGNGIKTVIPNMADIGTALKCDPGYPTKFFATELGALSKWDEERNVGIVNGEHNKSTLSRLLALFIEKYVLCPKCKLPETHMKIKKGMIYYKCMACGFYDLGENQHKLTTYILKHPPPSSSKKGKGTKEAKSGKKGKGKGKGKGRKRDEDEDAEAKISKSDSAKISEDDQGSDGKGSDDKGSDGGEDEGEIHFEITEEMRQMKVDENVEIEDPVEVMRTTIESGSDVEDTLTKVQQMASEKGFDQTQCFQYAFKAVISDSLSKQMKANLPLLSKLVEQGRPGQFQFLACLEERCEAYPANLNGVAATLMLLYDKDVIEEEHIIEWHTKGVSQLIALADDQVAISTRKAADKFVQWLESAEEESDDE